MTTVVFALMKDGEETRIRAEVPVRLLVIFSAFGSSASFRVEAAPFDRACDAEPLDADLFGVAVEFCFGEPLGSSAILSSAAARRPMAVVTTSGFPPGVWAKPLSLTLQDLTNWMQAARSGIEPPT